MRRPVALLAAFVLVLGSVGQAAAAGGSSADKAKLYYLSVGDSLAAGVQPIGNPDELFRTDRGYAEQLLQTARARYPKLALEKLGCPGETTTTMIQGGICTYDEGSQLDEAIAFLHAHRQFVAFVTIDIGANDFPCQAAECIPAGVGTHPVQPADDPRRAARGRGPGRPDRRDDALQPVPRQLADRTRRARRSRRPARRS